MHCNVTANPTARWTAQQIVEAFPFDTAPRYLLRDRDCIYGDTVRRRIKSLGIEEVITARRSPRQNPFVERVIGSIRRNCLDHVIVLNERHLRPILREYCGYYRNCRTRLSLNKDSPKPRTIQPPALGGIKGIQFRLDCAKGSWSALRDCVQLDRREYQSDPLSSPAPTSLPGPVGIPIPLLYNPLNSFANTRTSPGATVPGKGSASSIVARSGQPDKLSATIIFHEAAESFTKDAVNRFL